MSPLQRCYGERRVGFKHGGNSSDLESNERIASTLSLHRSRGMATNNLKGSLIKFGFYFRRLRRTALGTIVLGSCVAFAYAETDVHIESVTTSPRGTFRIEQERKWDSACRWGELQPGSFPLQIPASACGWMSRLMTRRAGISSFLRTNSRFAQRCINIASCRA